MLRTLLEQAFYEGERNPWRDDHETYASNIVTGYGRKEHLFADEHAAIRIVAEAHKLGVEARRHRDKLRDRACNQA